MARKSKQELPLTLTVAFLKHFRNAVIIIKVSEERPTEKVVRRAGMENSDAE